MATHSSVLGWRIPGTGELGGLPSRGSHRVGHDLSDLAAAAAAAWKRRIAKNLGTFFFSGCKNRYKGYCQRHSAIWESTRRSSCIYVKKARQKHTPRGKGHGHPL